jgi:hypothetical protein
MRDRLTPTQDFVVLCHLGVPRIEREHWSLTIDGMVERRRVWTESAPVQSADSIVGYRRVAGVAVVIADDKRALDSPGARRIRPATRALMPSRP